ncbi:hypothetical protein KBC99_00030 [Candidatus Saccharibacteria bacterium]|nr:hypothetical protein [Candidatus Saccharibacteria bacterium]
MTPTELYNLISESEGVPMQELNPLQYELMQIAGRVDIKKDTDQVVPSEVSAITTSVERSLAEKQNTLVEAKQKRGQADEFVQESRSQALQVGNLNKRVRTIIDICRKQYNQQLIDESVDNLITFRALYSFSLGLLGELAEIDHTHLSRQSLEELITSDHFNPTDYKKAEIALARARANKNSNSIFIARDFALTVGNEDQRVEILTDIAVYTKDQSDIAVAMEELGYSTDFDARVSGYLKIASIGGQPEALKRALQFIEEMDASDNNEVFNISLAEYAGTLAEYGDIEGALLYAEEAADFGGAALARIIPIIFAQGDEAKANSLLAKLTKPQDRARALAALAKILYEQADTLEKDITQPSISESPS